MSIQQMIKELRQERSQLEKAIQALEGLTGKTTTAARGKSSRRGSKMSAAARRKISLAQRARWAKRRSGSQSGAAPPKRAVSAASRRKMAAAQRARWAKAKREK